MKKNSQLTLQLQETQQTYALTCHPIVHYPILWVSFICNSALKSKHTSACNFFVFSCTKFPRHDEGVADDDDDDESTQV